MITVLWANLVSGCAILHSALSRVAVHHQQFGHKQGVCIPLRHQPIVWRPVRQIHRPITSLIDWLTGRTEMSDLQKNTLPDRPTLSDFGMADWLTTGVVLGQINTAYNGRVNWRWFSLILTVARIGGFEQSRGIKRSKSRK